MCYLPILLYFVDHDNGYFVGWIWLDLSVFGCVGLGQRGWSGHIVFDEGQVLQNWGSVYPFRFLLRWAEPNY